MSGSETIGDKVQTLEMLTEEDARPIRGVLFDLDDTFLERTRLTPEALRALYSIKEAGLVAIALTGRPASWAEQVVRMWPVDAAIAENGALAYRMTQGSPEYLDTVPAEVRAGRLEKLRLLVDDLRAEVPQLVPANDVVGRVSDYTFDIGENERPEEALIQKAIRFARQRGARTTRSSVHLHLSFDLMDKGSGALHLLQRMGHDASRARFQFAFIGDSQNDAEAFAVFRCSVGVANLRGIFSITPRFVTSLPRSAGFCQFAQQLISQRSQ